RSLLANRRRWDSRSRWFSLTSRVTCTSPWALASDSASSSSPSDAARWGSSTVPFLPSTLRRLTMIAQPANTRGTASAYDLMEKAVAGERLSYDEGLQLLE